MNENTKIIKEKAITVFSHKNFDRYCMDMLLTDEVVEMCNDKAFISIIGTEECQKYYLEEEEKHFFKENHPNVINLEFDDLDKDIEYKGHTFKAMSQEQADKLYQFIEYNKDKDFYIHCRAGVSRSCAVGRYIHDVYGGFKDIIYLNNNIAPSYNVHVHALLKRAYYNNNLFIQ